MNRSKHIILIVIVVTIGVWGCARQTSNAPGQARVRDLEARLVKLEDDYRAALAQRDQFRRAAKAMEQKCTLLASESDQLRTVTQERDELRRQVAILTNDRNNAQTNLTLIVKDLHQILGRAEPAVSGNTSSPAVVPASTSLAQPVTSEGPVIEAPGKS